MTTQITARPIDQWPGEFTKDRQPSPFSATWTDTVDILDRELYQLDARNAVLQLAVTEQQCRRDGWIRADARPQHPGVILSFDSVHGPLRYHTDRFMNRGWAGYLPGWQSNVRAIALGLEALRRVDRYGITRAGEQYRGWNALPPGGPVELGAAMTVDEAARTLADWSGQDGLLGVNDPDVINAAWRRAARDHHPDHGGDPEQFRRITEARDLLLGRAS
jgi:hypothetical protein